MWEIASSFLNAQLKKVHRHWRLVRVERRMMWGELEQLKEDWRHWDYLERSTLLTSNGSTSR
jgi:hypothetical protein